MTRRTPLGIQRINVYQRTSRSALSIVKNTHIGQRLLLSRRRIAILSITIKRLNIYKWILPLSPAIIQSVDVN